MTPGLLYFHVFIAVVVGGMDMMTQSLMLAKKPHVIIGKILYLLSF